MTTAAPDAAGGTRRSADGFRRAYRPVDARVVAGVSAGLAEHLRLPVVWVRVGFVLATFVHGTGLLAYLLLWWFLPLQAPVDGSPGLESARRRGLRTGSRGPSRRDVVQSAAIGAVGLGVLGLIALGGGWLEGWMLPLLLVVTGIAVVWRMFDDAAWNSWLRQTEGPAFAMRLLVGLAFIGLGAIYILTVNRGWSAAVDFFAALAIAVVGLSLILGPWILGLWTDLGTERRERIRSQERADVAAHLHDSVLQTLALLQKNADDPATVATLARRQERELRDWLYGRQDDTATFATALRDLAAEVEANHRVPVEVVTVGDAAPDDGLRALLAATGEAVVNAAKHSGASRVDVYAERVANGSGDRMEVFVRDRGTGFDPDAVPADRLGVKNSIIGRAERHGGTARVRSTPEDGTEVALTMPVSPGDKESA
ncbi:PspC domain-containing protein [Aeromicrobium tamlense]|uniref:Phage shock protein PspC (Stress-responsive transcriptional regulator)/anti-sigma regulatory factor (Ser/Thr protein kinase) n=1 Tax=Aeromicrobium tamlense TaxID=375541 RepID=A0A8I0FX87_9ACTN|nr:MULTISPECIES: ATP-binding protein [Aeromicrobium]MBD1270273.1 PspC domain-containing protein [Aeromicrobium tamlense]NYI39069.1 phage shock protein PspC (stress-responsive transcriptional regulator)/anti-sigma regulatory factor (Ser/Thr protein kinase) [Aeromicrobium tamlense]